MILAAGLTPAWQQILSFESFRVGEVNRAAESIWCASGKVLNVGLALHHLCARSKTVALVGGRGGEAIRSEIRELGHAARWVTSTSPTRICTTILDRQCGSTTELVENSRVPAEGELDAFLAAYTEEAADADFVVLSGSLPSKTPATFYRELLAATRGRAILDVRGAELIEAMVHQPFLVKPNREELGRTLARSLHNDRELQDAMRELNRLGARWVVVTQGKDRVWATTTEEVFCFQPPVVDVVNPIGCGDCMAAGIAWGLDDGCGPVDAIRLGIAAAAVNAGQLLPSRLHPQRVRTLAETIEVVSAS